MLKMLRISVSRITSNFNVNLLSNTKKSFYPNILFIRLCSSMLRNVSIANNHVMYVVITYI